MVNHFLIPYLLITGMSLSACNDTSSSSAALNDRTNNTNMLLPDKQGFEDTMLNPGQLYQTSNIYKFSVKK
jgi:hypothetical protein